MTDANGPSRSTEPIDFTTAWLKALQHPDSGQIEYFDAKLGSWFGVRVGKKTKSFFVRYRVGGRRGKERRVTLGRFPEVPLSAARDKARDIKTNRRDPGRTREQERKLKNFGGLVDQFKKHYQSQVRAKTWSEYDRVLDSVCDDWGELPIADVTRTEVKLYLREKAAEHPYAANRLRGVLHRLFTWANENEILESNPVANVKRPGFGGGKEPQRERVLKHDEIRRIWRALDPELFTFRAFVEMLFLTGLRKTEVLHAKWADVDLEGGWWRIPQTATKSGIRLDVPIIEPMRDLFAKLEPYTGASDHVFASFRGTGKPLAGVSKFKRRVSDRAEIVQNWRLHDIRRTVTTELAEMGIPDNVLRALLGHAIPGTLEHYQRGKFSKEKRAALELWSKKLDRIVADEKADIVPFEGTAE